MSTDRRHPLAPPTLAMRRRALGPVLALMITLGGCSPRDEAPSEAPSTPRDALSEALSSFVDAIEEVEQDLRASPSFGSEAERVGGYRHMLRALAKAMEAEVIQDADFPYFRIVDFWLREGGDNPDQRYAFAPIRGGEAYRIWGNLGSADRVEFQLYAGVPWAGAGRSAGYLAFEDLSVAGDGTFEVILSATRPPNDLPETGQAATPIARAGAAPSSWIENPVDASTIVVRHVFADWSDAATGDVHIDRIGYEGRRRPLESEAELAARIRNAAEMFATSAQTWPRFVEQRYGDPSRHNAALPPYDSYSLGGAKGRWMSGGAFDLGPEEVLLLRMPPTRAKVQGIQLTDMWFASLEHGNLVSSLTTEQSLLSPDGQYYYVISAEDPGHANWLDTGGLTRGTFLIRWDGVEGDLGADAHPEAEVLEPGALPDRIPGFARVSEASRAEERTARRRHLQIRSHR